jgi:ATP-dependent Clp protease ATP-binding subunit ClpB
MGFDWKSRVHLEHEETKDATLDAMKSSFRPEFINRLDDIVEFDVLDRSQIGEIVALQTHRVIERLAEKGIALEMTPEARELIGDLGYDPVYGARPLKRVIQKRLVDPLALAQLQGDIADGARVRVEAADGELVLVRAPVAEDGAA